MRVSSPAISDSENAFVTGSWNSRTAIANRSSPWPARWFRLSICAMPYTGGHSSRGRRLCAVHGGAAGIFATPKSIAWSWRALLHDIGKISVPITFL